MRFAVSVVALAATVAAQVQPISQIDDGQIQAPPATATAPEYTTPTAPAVSTPVAVSSVSEGYSSIIIVPSSLATPIVPSAVNTSGGAVYTSPIYTTPVVPVFTNPAPSNGSASAIRSSSVSGSGSSPSSSASASGASGTPPPESNGAAANMVSFGGLAVVLGAAFFA